VVAWLRKTESSSVSLTLDGPALAELIEMVETRVVSSSAAKEVLDGVLAGEGRPRAVAEGRDLMQVTDQGALAAAIEQVLSANPRAVESFRAGEEKVLGFLVGQVMRATQGKADPAAVSQMLRERLSG
jgi:aspartyl-tRNA(Asn)/glutamyl-tRNA(Gln) amidotransferase subunit B